MRLTSIHNHTVYSDGKDEVETLCNAAFEKRLFSFGISDHAPIEKKIGFKTEWNIPEEKLCEYIDAVQNAKKRWEGRQNIYLGLEVDFAQGIIGPGDKDYLELNLDYIIGSVHYLVPHNGKPFTVDDSEEKVVRGVKENYNGDVIGMVEAYFDSVEAMIKAGGLDMLGHPDLVKLREKAFPMSLSGEKIFFRDNDYYKKRINAMAALIAVRGIPVEINTGGLTRGKTSECYPSSELLKVFHKHGVQMVISADAHRAADLTGNYDVARKTLLASGYTETLLFAGRQNGKPLWETEKLI